MRSNPIRPDPRIVSGAGSIMEASRMTDVSEQQAGIVVGVDGSPQAASALRWAVQLGELLNCDVEAVMAWGDPLQYGWSPGSMFMNGEISLERDAEKALEQAIDDVFPSYRPP